MNKRMLGFVAMGMAGGVASLAGAQPFLVNGSGATLMENFFNAPAATNDLIDADGDGRIAILGDQLAPRACSDLFGNHWVVTYRVVGSGNGFAELRDWGFTFNTNGDGEDGNGTLNCAFSDSSIVNRQEFCADGVISNCGEPLTAGGNPLRVDIANALGGDYSATLDTSGVSGVQIDFAAIDVPVSWFVLQDGGRPLLNNVPGEAGYGNNERLAIEKDGSAFTSRNNKLKALNGLNGAVNTNVANPNELTVFDYSIALVPVAAMTNFGTGLMQIETSDLRHLTATGRLMSGENLMKVTRDSGSGTRNAFMNGICLDPSWGAGENIGERTVSSSNDLLGPDFQPSNKGGSSRVESTTTNHRLAIGHTGAERGFGRGWLIDGDAELLAVRSDIRGGSQFIRPTLDAVLDGGPDGYNITGPGVVSSIGDARSAPSSLGGLGWLEPFTDDNGNGVYDPGVDPFIDINGSGVRDAVEARPPQNELNPAMRNPAAASFINNILRSVQAFNANPPAEENFFTPGEWIALNFVSTAAAINAPQINPDPEDDCIPLVPNPEFNQDVQDFLNNNPDLSVFSDPAFASFNMTIAGLVPVRTANVDYNDGAGGDNYINQGGATVSYGSNLNLRNLIAGDFDGDEARTLGDVSDMLAAWNQRNGDLTPWIAPDGTGPRNGGSLGRDAIIEVLGDFDGDGMFTTADVRYWADGLAMVGGQLDRDAGFSEIDSVFGGNFFETELATLKSYESGDSRGDIANESTAMTVYTQGQTVVTVDWSGVTRNFAPTGTDGVVDDHDIDYLYQNFKQNAAIIDGEVDWTDTFEAVHADLSADMNGDLLINQADADVLVRDILGTDFGDVDLDGDCDQDDRDIAAGNLGNAGGWADGDVDGDGHVTQADLDTIDGCISGGCPGDLDGDDDVDADDFFDYLDAFANGGQGVCDIDGDGDCDADDFFGYLDLFAQGC